MTIPSLAKASVLTTAVSVVLALSACNNNKDFDYPATANTQDNSSDSNSSVTADSDKDGIINNDDNCPNIANPDQNNIDNDIQGDVCDSDRDGDGVLNDTDAFPDNPNEVLDTDGDKIGNNADVDDDNDGIKDEDEIKLGTDPNDSNSVPQSSDYDKDGVTNASDNCIYISNPNQLDTDKDGFGDVCDNDTPIADTANFSISQYLETQPKYSKFNAILTQISTVNGNTNLALELDTKKSVTFLLPDNEAFMKTMMLLGKQGFVKDVNSDGVIDEKDIIADKEYAQRFVNYHVLTNDFSQGFSDTYYKKLVNLAGLPLTINDSNEILSQAVQYDRLVNDADTQYSKPIGSAKPLVNSVFYDIDAAIAPPTLRLNQLVHQGKEVYQKRCRRDNGFKALPQLTEYAKIHRNAFWCEVRDLIAEEHSDAPKVPPEPFELPAIRVTPFTALLPNNTATLNKCKEYEESGIYYNGECRESWMYGYFRGIFLEEVDTTNSGREAVEFSGELTNYQGNFIEKDIIATDGVLHILDIIQPVNK